MSVAVCRGAAVPTFEAPNWLPPAQAADNDRPGQVDIWNAIQADKVKDRGAADKVKDKGAADAGKVSKPYVHPLLRRSSSLMSQKSLEVCTESLGSETGSGEYLSSFLQDAVGCFQAPAMPVEAEETIVLPALEPRHHGMGRDCEEEPLERKELVAVNYQFSGGVRSSRPRAFPPPLPSMSRRDGPCVQMRPHRRDGRLVVEAVPVRSRNYLHAQRQGGRLRLCFIDCSVRQQSAAAEAPLREIAPKQEKPVAELVVAESKEEQEEEAVVEDEEEEMEEEEVEVVDRGTVVEVKVSTQPQAPIAGGAKVHRSTLVINKFVGSTPLTDQPRIPADAPPSDERTADEHSPAPALRRVPSSTSTTTLAAAVAVASTTAAGVAADCEDSDDDGGDDCGGLHFPATAAAADAKLLFTSRTRDMQELLQSVRRCRQLRQKPLFILEPYCIATS